MDQGKVRRAVSPALSELLDLLNTAAYSGSEDPSTVDGLVAFQKKTPLTAPDLTVAFQQCFQNLYPSTLAVKVLIVNWLSNLLKKPSPEKHAPSAVIIELSKVFAQLNLSRSETEEWMLLLISLCDLTDTCLNIVRELPEATLVEFLSSPGSISLAAIILDTGKRHVDRTQIKRERSEGYTQWNQRALNLTKNFLEFIGDQVQQNVILRSHASDMTIAVCNMLLSYAEEARSEYAYLSTTFKAICALIPNCGKDRRIRLETENAVKLLCNGILGSCFDILSQCVTGLEVTPTFLKRRWTLARFYYVHLKNVSRCLFIDICGSSDGARSCRGHLRYLLFFMRSEVINKSYPEVQSEIVNFVNSVEDLVVSALFASDRIKSGDKSALIYEFSSASGPRNVLPLTQPLTDYEWGQGQLKFLLKLVSIFEEFPLDLQLQLYPIENVPTQESLLDRVVRQADAIVLREFGPPISDSDLYFRILSELVTFAYLVQPRQFVKLQIDMIGLVIGHSDLWSLVARDWWCCIADRFGQCFTMNQVRVLTELLITLPLGRASEKIGAMLSSLLPLLNEQSQLAITENLLSILEGRPDISMHTLLSSFPFGSLHCSSLDTLVNRCVDEWRAVCDLLVDERLVLDAFYTMHQYVACLASIMSCVKHRNSLAESTRHDLLSWSLEIIGGAQGLIQHVQEHERSKPFRTIEDIFSFLRSIQPLDPAVLIQVLETIISWEALPSDLRPLSRISISMFLRSCSTVKIEDETHLTHAKSYMQQLYTSLLQDTEWTVIHESVMSLIEFCVDGAPVLLVESLLQECIPEAFRDIILRLVEEERKGYNFVSMPEDFQTFWTTMGARTKLVQSQRFCTSTVSDLQAVTGARPSSYACMSAVKTVAQYLEVVNTNDEDNEFKERLWRELERIQKLAMLHKHASVRFYIP
ncbi:hypothetical protein BX616_007462 [Lobosporangium transversale]|nr:hypothetical protein BX616_007462 [Lobosporangium transversale]